MSEAAPPIVRLLRLVAGSRIVFQTRYGEQPAVARVLARPVPLELDDPIRRAVLKGSDLPLGLDAEQVAFLEGCRARASLGSMAGLPELAAAGVTRIALPGVPPAGKGQGHIHVVARWIEGRPLGELVPSLSLAARLQVLADLLRLLDRVHAGLVAHGGLTARDLIVDGQVVWLVDIATARRVAAGDPRLAGDVLAFGQIAHPLLAGAELPTSSPWPSAVRSCLAADPFARPTVPQLLARAGLTRSAGVSGDTIHVADPTAFAAAASSAARSLDPPTESVSDPVAPPGTPSRLALASLVLAIVAVLAAWLTQSC